MFRIWFHGTKDEGIALRIQREGFKPLTYFAANLQDALTFGGPHVFEVAIDFADVSKTDGWQVKASNAIPSESIINYSIYDGSVLADFPNRRRAVFDAVFDAAVAEHATRARAAQPASSITSGRQL